MKTTIAISCALCNRSVFRLAGRQVTEEALQTLAQDIKTAFAEHVRQHPECHDGAGAADAPTTEQETRRPRHRTVAQRIQQLLDESDDPAAMRARLDALANEDEEAPTTEQEASE